MDAPTTLHDGATQAPETPFVPNIAMHNGRPLLRMGTYGYAAEVVCRESGRLVGYYVSLFGSKRPIWNHVAVFATADDAEAWLNR